MAWQGPKIDNEQVKTDRLLVDERFELGAGYETITAAGAVAVNKPLSYLVTSGAIAITLANGYEGQVKTIIMVTDGGTATLTPANFANGTTITFDDALDMWQGIFHAGNWYSIGTPTATVA